jgi:hypothetical protein
MKPVVFLIVPFLAVGCMTADQMESKLRTRASFDLGCPEEGLTITELDTSTRGVTGCGRRQSYLGICQFFDCTWVAQATARE